MNRLNNDIFDFFNNPAFGVVNQRKTILFQRFPELIHTAIRNWFPGFHIAQRNPDGRVTQVFKNLLHHHDAAAAHHISDKVIHTRKLMKLSCIRQIRRVGMITEMPQIEEDSTPPGVKWCLFNDVSYKTVMPLALTGLLFNVMQGCHLILLDGNLLRAFSRFR